MLRKNFILKLKLFFAFFLFTIQLGFGKSLVPKICCEPASFAISEFSQQHDSCCKGNSNDHQDLKSKECACETEGSLQNFVIISPFIIEKVPNLKDLATSPIYSFQGDDYTAKYEVTLWDHFGLDYPDMEKMFNAFPSAKEVFICWFVLQHLRGYKPFITKITFTREFTGNINQEKAIRPVENKTNTNDYSIPKYEHGRIM